MAKKPKQMKIAEMEETEDREIELAAEEYVDIRNQRMELTKQEKQLAGALLSLMHRKGQTVYEFDGQVVSIEQLEKVRVRTQKEDGDDDV